MEITLQTHLSRLSLSIRIAFWRSISACMAIIMRAPRGLRAVLISLLFLTVAGLAYTLGRAAGTLLATNMH